MAKGNMFLGLASGKVADLVFYRSGGEQRTRTKVTPANPRTRSQQTQRATFTNAIKFYKLCVAKFFKFAYENKRTNESDYNAFMRENVARSCMMSRTAYYTETYPALGEWLMSRGSLRTLNNVETDNTTAPTFDTGASYSDTPAAGITIAEISSALVASGRYQVGDIITLIEYASQQETLPTATPSDPYAAIYFNYWQFLVDPNNTATFASIFGDLNRFMTVKTTNNTLAFKFGVNAGSADEAWRLDYQAVTIIHSRNTETGLKVSTQQLVVNPRYKTALQNALTDVNYQSAVLADWSANPGAILQGEGLELVDPFEVGGVADVTLYNGATVVKAFTGSTAPGSTLVAISASNLDKITLTLSGSHQDDFSENLLGVEGATVSDVQVTPGDNNLAVTISLTALTDADKSLAISYNGASVVNIEMHASNVISISDGVNVDLPYSYVSGVVTRACILDGDVESTEKKVVVKSYEPIDPVGLALYTQGGTRYTGEISVQQSGNTLTVSFSLGTVATRNADMCYLEDRNSTEIARFYPFASILTMNSYGIWDHATTDPEKIFP